MKKVVSLVLILIFVISCAPCLAGGTWISAVPDRESTSTNETVGVTILLGWWDACPGAALVRIAYDSKLLAFDRIAEADAAVLSVDSGKGELALIFCPATGSEAGTGETELVKLVFTALKTGECFIRPSIISITDSRWMEISSESFETSISIQ